MNNHKYVDGTIIFESDHLDSETVKKINDFIKGDGLLTAVTGRDAENRKPEDSSLFKKFADVTNHGIYINFIGPDTDPLQRELEEIVKFLQGPDIGELMLSVYIGIDTKTPEGEKSGEHTVYDLDEMSNQIILLVRNPEVPNEYRLVETLEGAA